MLASAIKKKNNKIHPLISLIYNSKIIDISLDLRMRNFYGVNFFFLITGNTRERK